MNATRAGKLAKSHSIFGPLVFNLLELLPDLLKRADATVRISRY
ncbi:MAG: hypothetical protein ACREXN_00370 [Polaromonas sp.]